MSMPLETRIKTRKAQHAALRPLKKHLFISCIEKQGAEIPDVCPSVDVLPVRRVLYPTDPINGQKAAGPRLIPKQKHSSILPPLLYCFII